VTTLFDATLALAKVLGFVRTGTTTSAGSTTTLKDTARAEPSDYWNDGTAWLSSGADSGRSGQVLDFITASIATITFSPVISTAIASAVTYSLMTNDYPRDILIDSVNKALSGIPIPAENTALTTVADQGDYTLPAGVYNIKRVFVADSLSAPLEYKEWFNFYEIPGGTLRFDDAPAPSGYTSRLMYVAAPTEITADTATVSSLIPVERLKWEAAVHATMWKYQNVKGDDPIIGAQLAYAQAMSAQMQRKYPITLVGSQRAPRLSL
jgi:hypothetical protein